MNILSFTLDIWKLFAEQIGILELKNLVFVNKELFEKVLVFVGTNSLVEYKELYIKEYYKSNSDLLFNDTDCYGVKFLGVPNKRFTMLKDLCTDEEQHNVLSYDYVDLKYREQFVFPDYLQHKILSFWNCVNLPKIYTNHIVDLSFQACTINNGIVLTTNKIPSVHFFNCNIDNSIVLNGNIYNLTFRECNLGKSFKIIANEIICFKMTDCCGTKPKLEIFDIKMLVENGNVFDKN